MGKRMFLVGLLAIALSVISCSKENSKIVAPTPSSEFRVGDPTSDDVSWIWIDETHIKKVTTVHRWDPKLQKVTIGTIEVIYICDYPNNFIGPLPQGHCHEDGTSCS